jgi:hypothetical protein
MNLFDYKPLVAVPRPQIVEKIKQLQNAIAALEKELEERGPLEVEKWGFTTIIDRKPGMLRMGYATYDSVEDAHKHYMAENPKEDFYTDYYRIHRVYVKHPLVVMTEIDEKLGLYDTDEKVPKGD